MTRQTIAALTLSTQACVFVVDPDGQGERETRTLELSAPITAIEQHTFFDLEISVGADTTPSVTCTSRALDDLRLRERSGTLEIVMDTPRWPTFPRECRIELGVASLTALTVDGVGHTDVFGDADGLTQLVHDGTGRLQLDRVITSELRALTEGTGGLFIGELDADRLRLTHDGTGPVQMAGVADTVTLVASGTGGTDLGDLVARVVEVDASGTGPVTVHGTESVSGTLTGTGSVRIRGGGDVEIVDDGPGDVVIE